MKQDETDPVKNGFIQKLNMLPLWVKAILIVVVILDLLLIVMNGFGLYFTFQRQTGLFICCLLTAIAVLIAFYRLRVKGIWLVLILCASIFVSGLSLYFPLPSDHPYKKLKSPDGQRELMIEYGIKTSEKSAHLYHFYYKTAFPGLIRRINTEPYKIFDQHENKHDLDVLGSKNVEWHPGSVEFQSENGGIRVLFGDEKDVRYVNGPKVPLPEDAGKNVVQHNNYLEHTDVLEEFMAQSQRGEDATIRYAVEDGTGNLIAVYHFQSIKDQTANQQWIDVRREWYAEQEQLGDFDPFGSQQCSRIIKDAERNGYFLQECTHRWDIFIGVIQ